MDFSILAIIVQLIFLEGVLSIDNAAILGAMVARLPDDQPIPWPKRLAGIGERLHGVLGNQRNAALRVGLLGAYFGRGLMLLLASVVIQNPWLKVIGAFYLIRLAFDDLAASGHSGEDESAIKPVVQATFWITVLNVEMMDLVFSLDNVVAAVSLSKELWVVMTGVAIGIVAMRFAAGIFSRLVEKEPILKSAAYILVLNIGIMLLLEEFTHVEISDWARFGISISTIVLALAYAHIHPLRWFSRPGLIWLSQGFSIINAFVDWLIIPPKALLILLVTLFRQPDKSTSAN
jgi:tellurite resistance protein TerC